MTRSLLLAALLAAPLAHAQTRIAPNGLTGSETAFALAADGDRIMIGVPEVDQSQGAVYVAERTDDATQPWRIGVRLVPVNSTPDDRIGAGVSVVGDDVFFTSPGYEVDDAQGTPRRVGRISHYQYTASVGQWSQIANFVPEDPLTDPPFEAAIAYGGGAFVAVRAGADAVYVYEKTGFSTWARSATITAPAANSEFGSTLAMDDSTLVIGAPREGDGRAYVYDYDDASDAWGLTATLSRGGVSTPGGSIGRTRGAFSTFGASVAIDGSIIAVGAPTDVDRSMFTGSVFTFENTTANGWRGSGTLYGSGGVNNGRLGESVAVEGLRVVAGAPDEGDGAVYVFDGSQAESTSAPLFWSETDRLTQSTGTAGDFGQGVAVAGDLTPVALAPADLAVFVFDALAVSTDANPEADLRLSAPSPNPASGRTALALRVDAPQHVRATLVDALGRTVRTLLDGAVATEAVLSVEARDLAPGVYVVQVTGERFAATQILTIVR